MIEDNRKTFYDQLSAIVCDHLETSLQSHFYVITFFSLRGHSTHTVLLVANVTVFRSTKPWSRIWSNFKINLSFIISQVRLPYCWSPDLRYNWCCKQSIISNCLSAICIVNAVCVSFRNTARAVYFVSAYNKHNLLTLIELSSPSVHTKKQCWNYLRFKAGVNMKAVFWLGITFLY